MLYRLTILSTDLIGVIMSGLFTRWCYSICLLALIGCSIAEAQDAHTHVADAKREYAAVFNRSEHPCSADYSTVGYSQCMAKELAFIRPHLDAFVSAMRGIVSEQSSGNGKDPVDELALLNKSDAAWRDYKKNLCQLQFAWFANAGGTGSGPAAVECEWNLDREYMKRLAGLVNLQQLAK